MNAQDIINEVDGLSLEERASYNITKLLMGGVKDE